MIDTTIAHYRIVSKLGEGGMGEVYRATDTKLNRDVALKVLPEQFAADSQRMGRFQREAEVLASLDHPNIGAIYGIEDAGTTKALVLQLIEGPTLADRIAEGPIPVDDALEIAPQIVEALEAAHEKGIVHRDLKPANIKLTPEGQVKVLDFGLARVAGGPSAAAAGLSQSPTLTAAATQAGMLLGTAAYMSPEQTRGADVDKRTDIWAFGCVVFEMLTGSQALAGESLADTLGAIVALEPDWSLLPAGLAPHIRELLRRCLVKDPKMRLRDIGDARIELIRRPQPEESKKAAESAPGGIPAALPWGLTAALTVAAAYLWWSGSAPAPAAPEPPTRLSIELAEPIDLGESPSLALSPDGSRVVYVASTGAGTHLRVRPLGQYGTAPIAGTEGAAAPFFSADGQWIGFFAGGKLKKVAVAGGAPVTLVDAEPLGGDWSEDGTIVFVADDRQEIARTTATGSPPEPVTRRDVVEADDSHHWPQLLPGSRALLFTIAASSLELDRLAFQRIGESERSVLVEGAPWGRYVEPAPGESYLIFLRQETLFAAPFDPEAGRINGRETPVAQDVRATSMYGPPQLALSESGTLVYVPTDVSSNDFELVWVDRNGEVEPITDEIRGYEDLHLSPDGRRVAFTNEAQEAHVWLLDIQRQTARRLVAEGESRDPVWTPDGRWVSYGTKRDGRFGLHRRAFDGSGAEEELFINDQPLWVDPVSWSPDGQQLVFVRNDPETLDDIWIVTAGQTDSARPLIQTPAEEYAAKISPDGRWIAYNSNESGTREIYVQPFPDGGRRWQISSAGGRNMDWSSDGSELFYRVGDQMMVVRIDNGPGFSPSRPELLFRGVFRHSGRDFAPSPDASRFVMMRPLAAATGTRLNVVSNWFQVIRDLTAE